MLEELGALVYARPNRDEKLNSCNRRQERKERDVLDKT